MNDDKQNRTLQKTTAKKQQNILDFERGKVAAISSIPPKKTNESNKIKK